MSCYGWEIEIASLKQYIEIEFLIGKIRVDISSTHVCPNVKVHGMMGGGGNTASIGALLMYYTKPRWQRLLWAICFHLSLMTTPGGIISIFGTILLQH